MDFIAEIGWNFIGDMHLAQRMIESASVSGATIAKFQLWNPKTLKSGAWDHDGRRDIYKKAALDPEKIFSLRETCKNHNVSFLMSVFEQKSLSLLSDITHDSVKIPSHECINFNLIDAALNKFNKVIVSIGALDEPSLRKFVKRYKNQERLDVMHCVSSYPLAAERVNLLKIVYLLDNFKNVGYSSHYQGISDAIAATTLGASFIEKHFTIDNDLPGRDNKFALLPEDFKQMVQFSIEASQMMLDQGLGLQDCEKDVALNMRGRWGG